MESAGDRRRGTGGAVTLVTVALTGDAGQQGGLGQSSPGYQSPAREGLTVDGRDAVFVPATGDH